MNPRLELLRRLVEAIFRVNCQVALHAQVEASECTISLSITFMELLASETSKRWNSHYCDKRMLVVNLTGTVHHQGSRIARPLRHCHAFYILSAMVIEKIHGVLEVVKLATHLGELRFLTYLLNGV